MSENSMKMDSRLRGNDGIESRYQAYPEYKNSGVEWIGSIPQDWGMWKIIHACPYVASGTTPKAEGYSYYEGEYLWVTTGELRETLIFDTQKKVTKQALFDMSTLRLHPKGSVAIAMYGATIGRLGIFGKDATTNQACCVMPPSEILHNKYLFYWLYATRQEIVNLSSGGGQPNVNQEKIASLKVSAPTFEEQTQIALFLDHETAKIDTLIKKQQKLIKLLKEKRQAVISHAVTKGLNPDAPMKDSGVEWFKFLPTQWKVGKLGYFAKISNGATPSRENLAYWTDGTIGWLNSSKVNDIFIYNADQFISPLAVSQTSVKTVNANDIVMAITGEGQTRGRVAICKTSATINQHLASISIRDAFLDYNYLFYWLTSAYERIRFESTGAGSTKGAITCSDIVSYPLPIPPLTEQFKIVAYIRNAEEKFNTLLQLATEQITLLQERRTALISAAVTGKIDVRNWQPPVDSRLRGNDGEENGSEEEDPTDLVDEDCMDMEESL